MGEAGTMSTAGQSQEDIPPFDAARVRDDFPILDQMINGHPLVYLDNAATTQKPQAVIEAVQRYYLRDNSNVHRGAHSLSDRATIAFEQARVTVARFINSPTPEQLIWTRGTTEAINLVAQTWGRSQLQHGDKILVSTLEHHSNIVPWQLVAQATGAHICPIPVNDSGDIDLSAYHHLLDERVKLVAINHISNALGTINPVAEIITAAHEVGAKVLLDGAQSVAHLEIDVQALDCDFFAFSGHKMFGPTGIGALWGKESLLRAMPPYQGGGEMIETVSFNGTTFNSLPFKFEAGTPNIAGAIGMAAAVDYLQGLDRAGMHAHEQALLGYCIERGAEFGLRRVGAPVQAAGVYSFLFEGAHPSDIGMLLDQQGIAVRTGHHCTQPLMTRFNIPGTVRASFSIYNTQEDVDRLFAALEKVKTFFSV